MGDFSTRRRAGDAVLLDPDSHLALKGVRMKCGLTITKFEAKKSAKGKDYTQVSGLVTLPEGDQFFLDGVFWPDGVAVAKGNYNVVLELTGGEYGSIKAAIKQAIGSPAVARAA